MKVLFEMPKYRQSILGFVVLGHVYTSPWYGLSAVQHSCKLAISVLRFLFRGTGLRMG